MTVERAPAQTPAAPTDPEPGLFVLRLDDAVPAAERAAVAQRIAEATSLDASKLERLLAKPAGAALVRPSPLALLERVQRVFAAAGAGTYLTPARSADDAAHRARVTMQRRRDRLGDAASASAPPPASAPRTEPERPDPAAPPAEPTTGRHAPRPPIPGLRPVVVVLALVAAVAAVSSAFLPSFLPGVSYLELEGGGGGVVVFAALATAISTLARRYWGALGLALTALFVAGFDFVRLSYAGAVGGAVSYGWISLFVALGLALLAARLGIRARGRS